METTQERVLSAILACNANTIFGRRYAFGEIEDGATYRARVPIMDGSELEAWVNRIQRGETGLLTEEKVLLLEPTGGSRTGTRLVPYTQSLKSQFHRAISAWVADLFWRYPRALLGPAYWAVTPPLQHQEASVVPVGFEDDGDYLGPLAARLVAATRVRPPLEPDRFWEVTAASLRGVSNLRLFSVWSPTFLQLLVEALPAGEPADWWPHLEVISCWADGPSRTHAQKLRQVFPGVALQPKGLLATEGVVSIPVAGQRPLAVTSHYLEFEQEGRVLAAHQLETGQPYSVLLTTGGGLYRYRLGDRVVVDGFYGHNPSLTFVGREHTSDRFGEKLHEYQVAQALAGLELEFALVAYQNGRYWLFGRGTGLEEKAIRLERELGRNFHYRNCRVLGQLQAVRAIPVDNTAEARYLDHCLFLGQRLGDIKPVALHPGEGWLERFQG